MVKVCPECEFLNKENAKFCGKCSTDLNGIEAVDERSLPEKPVEKLWVWQDSASIIGFISTMFGIFVFSVILLPVGLVCSIFGLKSPILKVLSIFGIVLSILAALIKVVYTLIYYDMIPSWVMNGIIF